MGLLFCQPEIKKPIYSPSELKKGDFIRVKIFPEDVISYGKLLMWAKKR